MSRVKTGRKAVEYGKKVVENETHLAQPDLRTELVAEGETRLSSKVIKIFLDGGFHAQAKKKKPCGPISKKKISSGKARGTSGGGACFQK